MTYGRGKERVSAYRAQEVLSRSGEGLVVLLYQKLLTELKRADHLITEGRHEAKGEALSRASSILFELLGSLDFEKGEEIAPRLAALYSYFIREVQEVDRSLDRDRLRNLTELIRSLHASWAAAEQAVTSRAG